MSATGRNLPGHERHPDDFYATPAWCIHALLDALPGWRPTLDPGCGTGALAAACRERGHVVWGIELDAGRAEEAQGRGLDVYRGDALAHPWTAEHVIANPPYGDALAWAEKAAREAASACFLTRIGLLAGQKRADFWRANPPDFLGVLSKRPSFAHGATDASEYAWIGWRVTGAADCRMVWLTPPDEPAARPLGYRAAPTTATQMDLLPAASRVGG
jgi:hypothetical protein